MRRRHLSGLLIVAILLMSSASLYAQHQQPDLAKLKADAQKLVSIISGDKAKIEAYCEATDIGEQIVEAAQDNNEKKAAALMQRMDELEKTLGPEYRRLLDALYEADPDSKDVQDILAMLAMLDQSCPE
jgi:type VI protein secretion system component VasK